MDIMTTVSYDMLILHSIKSYILLCFLIIQVNSSNIKNILPELFGENLIRGRGLFARSCMKSQMASPTFTHVFAALVAVVNTKFPELGELLLKRVILQLKRSFKRNDKVCFFSQNLVNLSPTPVGSKVKVEAGFYKGSCWELRKRFGT